MLQSMGSQRVRHNLALEQQQSQELVHNYSTKNLRSWMLMVRAEFLPTMGYIHDEPRSVGLKLEYIRILWVAKMQTSESLLRVTMPKSDF